MLRALRRHEACVCFIHTTFKPHKGSIASIVVLPLDIYAQVKHTHSHSQLSTGGERNTYDRFTLSPTICSAP